VGSLIERFGLTRDGVEPPAISEQAPEGQIGQVATDLPGRVVATGCSVAPSQAEASYRSVQ
jgi:hypothetical protein